jgi:hypothetical protein
VNGKKAKQIRKMVHKGNDFRNREYFQHSQSGQIKTDVNRTVYQKMKKIYKNEGIL